MKKVLLLASVVFALVACESKATTEKVDSTAADTATVVAPVDTTTVVDTTAKADTAAAPTK